ncbi:UTRA domain-containing protein [Antribacter sp. KLBMP9083]|uniref:UTRA domain-containing protein n=1 Tax=Antribacter soli TaxID=2910976 RepID=A0AA41QEI4_9MICO|nr:UTRA domain-containing protein [Antribacter soli]MCF4122005.1 UTRA domain-containing protein [Antribacter soli]
MSKWTSVSLPYVVGNAADAWAAEASAAGGIGTQRLLSVTEHTADNEAAAALGLDPGDLVIRRSRVMLLDDHPVELVDSHYPVSIARGTRLAEERKVRGGAVGHLAELGYPVRKVIEDVTARLATEAEVETFGLAERACVIELRRVILSDDDLPVEATVMTSPADGRRLRYEITP